MAKKTKKSAVATSDVAIDSYKHIDKTRKNNPPVGLVSAENDGVVLKKTYSYDPHFHPQLNWSGKAEHLSLEVDTVSLHVHERIDPYSIIEKLKGDQESTQQSLFESPKSKLSQKAVIEFYKHEQNWTNRLIAGDSILVMNSLLEKEGMNGKVQMIFFDPPYGIKYGSNFQPFVNKKDVKDGKDEDLNQEPEMLKAFRDTWELGIHSYLQFIKDRMLLSKEMLSETGSIFVQISDENLHLVRCVLDEVFGKENFCKVIPFQKTSGQEAQILSTTLDYLIWYSKDKKKTKYRQLYHEREVGEKSLDRYDQLLLQDGTYRRMTVEEIETGNIPPGSRRYQLSALYSDGESKTDQTFKFEGTVYKPRPGTHWKTTVPGLERLAKLKRIEKMGTVIRYRRFADDFPVIPLTDRWDSVQLGTQRNYVVETSPKVIERCILMSTDPGDLVLDITCGSGTTPYVAENWGRRWIACDTSRIAITLTKLRLLTSTFQYYALLHEQDGVGSGFQYETVPHITLKSLANNEPHEQEVLYDKPISDKKKLRVTGPFTVEAVPAPTVKSIEEYEEYKPIDTSLSRTSAVIRYSEWKDELLKTGIRAKNNERIEFSRLETLQGTKFLHAEGETKGGTATRIAFSFGQDHKPLDQVQVQLALEEATTMVPKPKMVCFCSFQFDPEAAKDIDEINWPGVQVLKVQMNTDLLTKDLKKKQSSSDSFFFIGSPDVIVKKEADQYFVTVNGFDYYNVKTGQVESGDNRRIAMWLLDIDYDGRSIFPTQIFFPMAGPKDGWDKLSKNLKANLDEEKLEFFKGNISIPFNKGKYGRAAIKIIDDRGIESLKIVELK